MWCLPLVGLAISDKAAVHSLLFYTRTHNARTHETRSACTSLAKIKFVCYSILELTTSTTTVKHHLRTTTDGYRVPPILFRLGATRRAACACEPSGATWMNELRVSRPRRLRRAPSIVRAKRTRAHRTQTHTQTHKNPLRATCNARGLYVPLIYALNARVVLSILLYIPTSTFTTHIHVLFTKRSRV